MWLIMWLYMMVSNIWTYNNDPHMSSIGWKIANSGQKKFGKNKFLKKF